MAKLDLKDIGKDIKLDELFDEIKSSLADRAEGLIGEGRSQARRAVGGHDDGTLFAAFSIGICVGALIGAAVALLMTPFSGDEARRKLTERVEKVRGVSEPPAWETQGAAGNGRTTTYETTTPSSFGAS